MNAAHPEVVVVGAGITGASITFHLSREGTKTTLIEKGYPASGPTGRSSAIVHAFYLHPELSELAFHGTEMLRNLHELTGGSADFRAVGMLWVCGHGQVSEWAEAVERIRGLGAEIEALSVREFAELAPGFALDDIALAVWEPSCGYADPATSTTSLVDGGRRHGADVRLGTVVLRLLVESGRVVGVETERAERVYADMVIVAAGPWTRSLVLQAGIDLPLHVERHPMAVVDAPGRAQTVLPFAWCDDILTHYARPEGENSILVGTWSGGGTGHRNPAADRPGSVPDPDSYEENVELDESAWIVRHMTPRLPALATLGLRRGYAGLYDMSPDDLPIIGNVAEGLFVAAGTSGHGFKLGPAVGEEVARLVITGESPRLAPFHLERSSLRPRPVNTPATTATLSETM
jgi:sarcosine oxidase subunit beta